MFLYVICLGVRVWEGKVGGSGVGQTISWFHRSIDREREKDANRQAGAAERARDRPRRHGLLLRPRSFSALSLFSSVVPDRVQM